MVTSKTFVKLVKFHQNARVGSVEAECSLHHFHCNLIFIQLIECCQCKISPHCRELGIKICRLFPKRYCQIILTFIIIKVAKVIWRISIFRVKFHPLIKRQHRLQAVGETEVWRHFRRFLIHCLSLCHFTLISKTITHIIASHRCRCIFLDCNTPHVECILPASGSYIVKSHLVIIIGITTHQLAHCLRIPRLIQATKIEGVDFKSRLTTFCSLLFASHAIQDISF